MSMRWKSVITYRTRSGSLPVLALFEEFSDLGDIIEHGPHWDCVEGITIQKNENPRPAFTIEDADEWGKS